MIARPLPAPREAPSHPSGWRTARNASVARRARVRRQRYRPIGRIVAMLGTLTVFVLLYLALLANITRLNYDVGHQKQVRAHLALATMRNEDEIAGLISREKLQAIAARLGMHDPATFAILTLPPRPHHKTSPSPKGIALLSGFAAWLK